MNKRTITLFVLSCIFFFSAKGCILEAAQSPVALDKVMQQLHSSYPGLTGDFPDVDREWNPQKDRSILWICSKKHHLFVGMDRTNGVVFLITDVATGRNPGQKMKVGDMRTPEGMFSVSQIQDASWWKPYEDRKTGEKTGYGPFFIRLDTGKWKGIGIHGTDPSHLNEIGTDASHGCLRLRNEDLIKVKSYAMVGQKVVVLP